MAVSLTYMPIMTFRDTNDTPIPFAKVQSFQANTTTPLALYADPAGTAPLANPAICSASGTLVAYMTIGVAYKLNVLDANNVQVPGWPIDNIQAIPSFQRTKRVSGQTLDVTSYFTPTGSSQVVVILPIPDDWVANSDLTFTYYLRANIASGVAQFASNVMRTRKDTVLFSIGGGAFTFAPGNLNTIETVLSVIGTNFLPGDILRISLTRNGDDVGDTMANPVDFDGHFFTYTGISGF
jgi:hypothetical protein